MRLTSSRLAVLGAVLLALTVLPFPAAGATSPACVRILFDLGDGTYAWANETVPNPDAMNATWLAVQRAALANGISISWSWSSLYGVDILDVGGRNPPGFVGVYEWNASTRAWDFANIGISSLVVSNGDAIALYNAGYDSVSFEGRTPVPTPDDPLPAIEFRGDLANSGTSISGAPDAVLVRWDRDTGVREIEATPAVAYGKVFVTTRNGTFALDAQTGATVWKGPEGKGFSSPAVFDNSVIVGTSNGSVVRLNASDGSVRWERRLLAQTRFSGITSSPKVAFDWVFIGTFNESGGPGEVVSLWASNGTVAWRHPLTGSVHYSSPAYANGTVYVGIMGTYNTTSQVTFDPPYGVVALDAATGREKWFYPTLGSVAASPAIAGSRLIVPSKDGNVSAIDWATGTLDWRVAVDAGISSPAVWGNTVFVGGGSLGGNGRVVALNVATGAVRWSFAPNGPVQAAITYADDKVLLATNTAAGTVYALNATTGSLVWSFEPAPSEYILSSPVVADGVVFAPSDNGHVYALSPSVRLMEPVLFLSPLDLGLVLAATVAATAIVLFVLLRRRRRGP